MNDFKAHADSTDLVKIEGFLKAGMYIYNTMLVMELDLSKLPIETGNRDAEITGLNTDDLTEYLTANAKGFGEEMPYETIAEELSNPGSAIYVIRRRRRIVSSVTIWDIDDNVMALENIFTVPAYRERGLSSKLVSFAIYEACRRGKRRIRLTVYGDDTEAIAMYYKFGFKVTKILQEFR